MNKVVTYCQWRFLITIINKYIFGSGVIILSMMLWKCPNLLQRLMTMLTKKLYFRSDYNFAHMLHQKSHKVC
jgi:hypothetical protein